MTTNELLQAKDKIIQEQAEKLQQMSEQIDELKKSVELYRQAAAMARAAQFGSKSEKTVPEGYEEQPLFNEAEQEASPKAKEPNLAPDDAVEVKTHKRKKRGSRDEMLKAIPHEEKICELPEDKMNCDACGSKLIPVGKKHVRTEVQRIPAQLKEALDRKILPQLCNARERWHDRKCAEYCDVAAGCPYGRMVRRGKEAAA